MYSLRLDSRLLETVRIHNDTAQKVIEIEGVKPLVYSGQLDANQALSFSLDILRAKQSVGVRDAKETYYTQRELTQIKQKPFDVKYPGLKGDFLVPVDSEGNTGVRALGYDQYDTHGEANIIDDEANDYRQAEISKKQFMHPVKTIGEYIEWNIQELREFSFAQTSQLSSSGSSLTERKTRAAIKAIKLKEEKILAMGDATSKLIGFYNNALLPAVVFAPDANGKTKWNEKHPAAIINDLNAIFNKVVNDSEEIYIPNTLLLPVVEYSVISTKPYASGDYPANETILSFWLKTKREQGINMSIVPYTRVNWAASDAVFNGSRFASSAKSRFICYQRDNDVLAQMYPQPLEAFGPFVVEGTVFRVKFRERHGGVHLRYPVACAYAENDKSDS